MPSSPSSKAPLSAGKSPAKKTVCLSSLPFPSVANNSFRISATDDKTDAKYRPKHFSPGDLPAEQIVIAFGEASFPVKKSFTGNFLPSAFIVCLSRLWPLILPAFPVRGQQFACEIPGGEGITMQTISPGNSLAVLIQHQL